MSIYIPFEHSDRLLSRVIGETYFPEPGRFSPHYKWHRELLAIVKQSLSPQRILATGSWAHDTAIAGVSDRDYFLVLAGAPNDAPAAILHGLHADLLTAVSAATEVYLDPPAVGVLDPYTGLGVEFVPAYRQGESGYIIPQSAGSGWMETDPVAHVTYLARAKSSKGDARNVIRLMKRWKVHAVPELSSLYVEMITARYYLEHPDVPYLATLTGVLTALANGRLARLPDPSLKSFRPIEPFSEPIIEVSEALNRVVRSQDLAFRIDAAEKSRAIDEVETCVERLFGSVPSQGISNPRRPRTRRDPNRMQFRGPLKGAGGHAGRARAAGGPR